MGREKNILLGILGLLAGVFVGVLSVKLLVPRPPTGTGPDICSDATLATAHERVEPPTRGGWDFAGAPPLVPEASTAESAAVSGPAPAASLDEPPRFSRFAAQPVDAPPSERQLPVDRDVTPASWQHDDTAAAMPDDAVDLPASPPQPSAPAFESPARDSFALPAAAVPQPPVAGVYLVQVGDSWWNLAERAYGDGALYRALFAWNRARDPRISLAPGTHLDVPPLDRLRAAWPRLTSPR